VRDVAKVLRELKGKGLLRILGTEGLGSSPMLARANHSCLLKEGEKNTRRISGRGG